MLVEKDESAPLVSDSPHKNQKSFWSRMRHNYDASFSAMLSLLYMNGGFKSLYQVAFQNMLKYTYNISPNQIQVAMAVIIIPWDFKILYGIICDTIVMPCFKKGPRRGWLIIFSLIQTIFLMCAGTYQWKSSSTLVWIFIICSLCGAFMDSVIDGITCVQQRKDHKYGAQDLQTWSWTFQSVGGISSSIIGGFIV